MDIAAKVALVKGSQGTFIDACRSRSDTLNGPSACSEWDGRTVAAHLAGARSANATRCLGSRRTGRPASRRGKPALRRPGPAVQRDQQRADPQRVGRFAAGQF